jgi:hypothetical protein
MEQTESDLSMSTAKKIKSRHALKTIIGFTPWLMSMYLLYWFESSKIWTSATDHRDIKTLLILAIGMSLSFLLLSYFSHREKR